MREMGIIYSVYMLRVCLRLAAMHVKVLIYSADNFSYSVFH